MTRNERPRKLGSVSVRYIHIAGSLLPECNIFEHPSHALEKGDFLRHGSGVQRHDRKAVSRNERPRELGSVSMREIHIARRLLPECNTFEHPSHTSKNPLTPRRARLRRMNLFSTIVHDLPGKPNDFRRRNQTLSRWSAFN